MKLEHLIAPSILSADFARLGAEVEAVLAAGADWVHFDVMDNHYVPNLTIGPVVCKALRDYGISAPIDVHLMVSPVDRLIDDFAAAGASIITFHPEASAHIDRSLQQIRAAGCQAGLVFNPGTPLSYLDYVLDKIDVVLLMSVNPGFGGQSFIPSALDKLRDARRIIDACGRPIRLEIDGGVKIDNIGAIAAAGADTFVAGSAIFGATDYGHTVAALREGSRQRHVKTALALFDLDGTLVDSAPDLGAALDDALRAAGRAPIGLIQVRDYIGDGAARLVHRALTGCAQLDAERAIFEPVYADFLSNYQARLFDRSTLYPGVAETLAVLREQSWTLACITNKPARFTAPLLIAAGLDRQFALTVSGDTLATRKPHPAPLLHAAARCGASLARSVMIGDSLTDLAAAANAGMAAVAVDYGYAGGVDLAAHGARAVISAMPELPDVLRKIVT